MNLFAAIAITAIAMFACGLVGLWAGLRIGYYNGVIAAMNHDALCGLSAKPVQEKAP